MSVGATFGRAWGKRWPVPRLLPRRRVGRPALVRHAPTAQARSASDEVPPLAARHALAPGAALTEEIRDSLKLLGGCLGATIAVAVLLHVLAAWAG